MEYLPCGLCGGAEWRRLLDTERLDGPLVKCNDCGLVRVLLPVTGGSGVSVEMERLAGRARELSLIDPMVEDRESPWRTAMAGERLTDLRRFVTQGRLIEIGSSRGDFLLAAGDYFEATGVEADLGAVRSARARGVAIRDGDLAGAAFPDHSFDVAVLYHVFEHLRHPHRELTEIARVLRPGGWLAIETPDIDTFWFRLLGPRWRQIIPDHLFFFTPVTINRLLGECGFAVREVAHVGKSMSLRLFVNRISRYSPLVATVISTVSRQAGLEEKTLRLNLGDVMRVYAQRI